MRPPILLTGGTGTLGRLVTPLLRDAGFTVRVLSRSSHKPADGVEFVTGDLATGKGVEAAVNGVETIVHCAGTQKGARSFARRAASSASAKFSERNAALARAYCPSATAGWRSSTSSTSRG